MFELVKMLDLESRNRGMNKIFRPWDSKTEQDSTVSTTTSEEVNMKLKSEEGEETIDVEDEYNYSKAKIKQTQEENDIASKPSNVHSSIEPFLSEYLPPGNSYLYSDVLHTSSMPSQSFPTDPFLETLQEEYLRVLQQEEHSKSLNKKQRPKKYKCPHCGVAFSNNGQLKGHIRIHTGERPFKCEEKDCGKTFTRNEELTRHKRIHSGLRPFSCNECGKSFGRKDHLKKHMKTHMQPRGLYAVPVMLPFSTWSSMASGIYPYVPPVYY